MMWTKPMVLYMFILDKNLWLSIWLVWTHSVGLCMVMLDTLRRTLHGYVGHTPSDSVWLCWTHSVGLRMVMLDTLRGTLAFHVGLWRCMRNARPPSLVALYVVHADLWGVHFTNLEVRRCTCNARPGIIFKTLESGVVRGLPDL